MARPLRFEFEGAVYHVMARGNNREPIVRDDHDVAAFLTSLTVTCQRYAWRVFGWCIMPNHYHLVVETTRPTLSRGMLRHNTFYAQRFNKRYGRVGHVFQSRYKAVLVQKERYLLTLMQYAEPVSSRAGEAPRRLAVVKRSCLVRSCSAARVVSHKGRLVPV